MTGAVAAMRAGKHVQVEIHGVEIDLARLGLPADGIQAQDREFLAAIREGREPNSSVTDVLPSYRTLADLEEATIISLNGPVVPRRGP
jgi:oxidoreductase family protein